MAELVAELLNPTAQAIHALLGAGVEGMRFAGRFELDKRQLAAVVKLHCFARLRARARDEPEAVGQVDEADVVVVGVDAFFMDEPLRMDREPRRTIRRTFRVAENRGL